MENFTPRRICLPGWLRYLTLLACLLAGLEFIQAKTFDYATDPTLVATTVDISSISARSVRLIDILTLVESQTNLKFIYLPQRLPLDDRIAIESGKRISLARLFYSISNLTGVVFTRHTLKVAVRRGETGDELDSAASSSALAAPERKNSLATS